MNTFTQAAWFQRNAAFESTLFHLYVQMIGHPTIKCLKLHGGLPFMSGLFPWYTPQKVNNVFTGWS